MASLSLSSEYTSIFQKKTARNRYEEQESRKYSEISENP